MYVQLQRADVAGSFVQRSISNGPLRAQSKKVFAFEYSATARTRQLRGIC